ncbi:hypothetical protein LUU34_01656000 [Aix galericulata]|nr:hypothetical protein LUU34_01656000 [Aix galericulata]
MQTMQNFLKDMVWKGVRIAKKI